MKVNTLAAIVATLIASAAAAPTEKRDLPLLGGHSGPIKSIGPLLDSIEGAIPGLGGSGSGQSDDTAGSLLSGLGGAGGAGLPGTMDRVFSEEIGQNWQQFCQLLLAVGLSGLIGTERQLRHKSAGLRTNSLVGLGSALFMLVSKYGFTDVLQHPQIDLDPSRIAAQIVSGIGFIGGGIIFKQQSDVRGLTTAAAVWLTAAVGSACGAGLPVLAALSTALYFVTVTLFPFLWVTVERVRAKRSNQDISVTIRYSSVNIGAERILDEILKRGASASVKRVDEVMMSTLQSPVLTIDRQPTARQADANSPLPPPMMTTTQGGYRRVFEMQLDISGTSTFNELVRALSDLEAVLGVSLERDTTMDEV
ncbi:hypothetical protein NLG97_g4573 [Lecanicillium saksenae]|uniref:Uncharacterized protein n=1 Tax=Lecanicillium saksenae TaxID=468837 RepID=A0ACC1QXG4_9HYPO|nr:hypothetical protein NLG97_g4573 [Lecanicillium saksenae]